MANNSHFIIPSMIIVFIIIQEVFILDALGHYVIYLKYHFVRVDFIFLYSFHFIIKSFLYKQTKIKLLNLYFFYILSNFNISINHIITMKSNSLFKIYKNLSYILTNYILCH
jgi:hypothetical protein